MFYTHLVTSFIVSSITIVVILLFRRLFPKQLSAKWQYNLWFLLLIALTLPLIPKHLLQFENHILFNINQSNRVGETTISTTEGSTLSNVNWMQDFTVSVNHLNLKFLNVGLTSIWIAGMVVTAVLYLHAWFNLKKIKKTTTVLNNKDILHLFERCKHRLNISKPLIVGESPLVKSPMTFGLFKTYVVLPVHLDERMSIKDIKYIFMHELHHYKNKDIATNYLMIIYQILYWFNPLVWIAFKRMRIDREIACDMAVLKSLDEHYHADYGNTIINFADQASHSKGFAWANQFNGPKEQMKKRIEKIASFTIESKWMRLKSISIFTLMGVFVASQVPFVSAMATNNDRYDFNNERTLYEDLSDYFIGYDGSFVLYDMKAGQYSIYNKDKSTLRVSPNSTYKIYSALIGLESDVITSDNSTMTWNGTKYPYESWNTDQNLSTAMSNSVTWYFQELDQRIPRETIQAYLEQMGYGNYELSGGLDYWMESSLKISPVEQVKLLSEFYTNQFEFKDKNIQTVKDSLTLEVNRGSKLSGKTGTGNVNGKNINGWFIGFVETKDNTYFFATNIQNEDNSYGSKAAEITLSILRDKGIY
ncbi:BlaR1 family beta-lactam sensor/signal transducer [Fredinandcohnia sp. QZ13]|uniref:BlaR1 family beta-lactam sensor/signal transducer n=1 Tax=Fredinandcohnia sp. QZ13 TaxID=3073144 RepID=UPI0028536525|nr:BlaR1 family beta-lactam sensor/signal transducer [Fredinandcohnia sp. QZ13]MDR4889567.1 BlaR1 family beta-lactam sensor/signal transducer [Fredinandcohnia sp. QZ13]